MSFKVTSVYASLLRLILTLAAFQQCFALLTVYQVDRANKNSPIPLRTIHDASVWLDSDLKLAYGSIEKAFVQSADSSLCYTRGARKAPKSKIPWILLASADNSVCSRHRKILAAENAGYAGIILFGSDSKLVFSSPAELASAEQAMQQSWKDFQYDIPVFFVDAEAGTYLWDMFPKDEPEKMHFIQVEKRQPWTEIAFDSLQRLLNLFRPLFNSLSRLASWCAPGLEPFVIISVAIAFFVLHEGDRARAEDEERRRFREYQARFRQKWRQQGNGPSPPPAPRPTGLMRSHFVTLGIPSTATHAEAHAAYKALCLRIHPDKSGSENTDRMQEVNVAWTAIDPFLRRLKH